MVEDWSPLGLLLAALVTFSALAWLIVAPFRTDQADNEIRFPPGEIGGVILLAALSLILIGWWWRDGGNIHPEFRNDTAILAVIVHALAAYSLPLSIWRWRWRLLLSDEGIAEFRWTRAIRNHAWSQVELGVDNFHDDYPHIRLTTGGKIVIPATKRNRQVLLSWFSRAGKSLHPPVRMPFWWRWRK